MLDAHPKFDATSVWAEHGVYRVTDYETAWTVDPGTGKILGFVGETPAWLQFMDNLHECFLSCEEYPGTIGVLVKEVPGTAWLGFDGAKVTWGGMVLGVFGLLLLYLSLTGIWLWFPRPKKWRSSMKVRWKRGRFARDTDLHKVAGMIGIPFMLMWAVTGAGYEFGFVEKGWYAVTPGAHREGDDTLSKKSKEPDITIDQAVASATALHPDARWSTSTCRPRTTRRRRTRCTSSPATTRGARASTPASSVCTSTGTPAWRRTTTGSSTSRPRS